MWLTNLSLVVVRRMTTDFHLYVFSMHLIFSVLTTNLSQECKRRKLQLSVDSVRHLKKNSPKSVFFSSFISSFRPSSMPSLHFSIFFISFSLTLALFPAECRRWKQTALVAQSEIGTYVDCHISYWSLCTCRSFCA
jgi:hypothetical protein